MQCAPPPNTQPAQPSISQLPAPRPAPAPPVPMSSHPTPAPATPPHPKATDTPPQSPRNPAPPTPWPSPMNSAPVFQLAPELSARTAVGQRQEPYRGTRELPFHRRRSFGPGCALIGDVGAQIDATLGRGGVHPCGCLTATTDDRRHPIQPPQAQPPKPPAPPPAPPGLPNPRASPLPPTIRVPPSPCAQSSAGR
jgi:hypothetical protein